MICSLIFFELKSESIGPQFRLAGFAFSVGKETGIDGLCNFSDYALSFKALLAREVAVDMKVMVLCGNRSARLRKKSEGLIEPIMSIGSQPTLWHIIKYYVHFTCREVVLRLGFCSEVINDFLYDQLRYVRNLTVFLNQKSCEHA